MKLFDKHLPKKIGKIKDFYHSIRYHLYILNNWIVLNLIVWIKIYAGHVLTFLQKEESLI